jgi:hypothetical protein
VRELSHLWRRGHICKGGVRGDLRSIAHAFHTTGSHYALIARSNGLRSEHDGLETTRADFVDSRRIRCDWHASAERDLSCGRLADAGLHDIAKVDFLDDGGVNLGLFKSAFESNDAEFGC